MTAIAFSVEHAQQLKLVGDAGFVNDGRHVFFSVAEVGEDLAEVHSLLAMEVDGSAARRIAEDLGDVGFVSASPDGSTLAVLAEREGKRQICLVQVDGGQPHWLTEVPQGVSGSPVFSPDGSAIAFTAWTTGRDPSLPYRIDRRTYRFDGIGYLDDAVTDIYVADVTSGSVRQLTSDRNMNADPRWSPDGRSLLYLVSFRPEEVWSFMPELHVLDVEGGGSRVVIDEWGAAMVADWCADGRRIAFVGGPADERVLFHARKFDLWTVDAAGGEPECRTEGLLAGVYPMVQADLPNEKKLTGPRIRIDGEAVYVQGQVGGDVVIYRVALSGSEAVESVVQHDGSSAYLVDFDRRHGVLYQATSFVQPPDLMLGGTRRRASTTSSSPCSRSRTYASSRSRLPTGCGPRRGR